MKENLFNKIAEKMACSLGEASIKLSENAMEKCCFGGIYETKIPIQLLKQNVNK
ncbi:hypothetical protein [Clostridium saccharobutylicum]|uniref:Cyclic lactone autoinducer peptide n=2 Tax=Clostridium saccharobutylicum TaxID=169679 RepID=U5N0V3_CLOSA|nr:hypothetical protein [Clostridium saccharobutylicum]AGX45382.1 hypothetical protein CLSA_c44450 [Clostridium saccharobutylicum DSM 13864]MBA8996653.1 cyclic lactone autoinducer peptide [Clostridium saccharobutylicum]NOV82734.1 cyclic lactone autoinducer peptide [Clostridium saccharobutylicum]NSB89640.1 cyclic lactone autoinducer peptide [Clostridium saccharobutylicum]NSC07769.1 cyclic lactone autoinducer peptide [Clostridium saccharobutylicum]